MIYDLVIGFAAGGILFSFLAIIIRLVDHRLRSDLAEILLSVALFSLMWFAFIYLMIVTRYIQYIPNLYNKGIPLYYLIAPCSYYYVRLKLYPLAKVSKRWLVHAIPFLFGLIDIVPYMVISMAEKQAFMSRLVSDVSLGYKHDYGFINQQWHYVIKLALAAIYLFSQWQLLFMADATAHSYGRKLRFSLYGYTVIFSLFMLVQLGMVFNIVFNRQQASYILMDFDKLFWVSLLYLLVGIWLCIGPYIISRRTT